MENSVAPCCQRSCALGFVGLRGSLDMPSMVKRVASMKVEKTSLLGRRASKEVKTTAMFVWGMS